MAENLYVVLGMDRHTDPEIEVHFSSRKAIERAREIVRENCRHEEYIKELRRSTLPNGVIFECDYSTEDDYVRVLKCPLEI